MARYGPSMMRILDAFGDNKPKSFREIVKATGLSGGAAYSSLFLCWKKGLVLRTKETIYEYERRFKGRGGISATTRPYHLYVLRPEDIDSLRIDGREFVKYAKEHLDVRGGGKLSKAKKILNFLRKNRDRAWFSTEVTEALKDEGVKARDIMANVRRFEKKGQVYARGYKTDDRRARYCIGNNFWTLVNLYVR